MQQIPDEGEQPYSWLQDGRLAACLIGVGLLATAGGGLLVEEGFYTFLRIYVSGAAAGLAVLEWHRGRVWLPLSAVLIAILFNPIRPIEMDDASSWQPYDWGAAAWFAAVGLYSLIRSLGRRLREQDARTKWAVAAMLAAFAAVAATIPFSTAFESADIGAPKNTMNVDENLTAPGMNARTKTTQDIAATNDDPFNPPPDIAAEVLAEKAYGPVYSERYQNALRSARANALGKRLGIPADIVDRNSPNLMSPENLKKALQTAEHAKPIR